jgi:hypothetical protein
MIQLGLRGTKADLPWSMKPAIKSGLDIAPNPKLSPRFGESTRSRVFHLSMSSGAGRRRRGWRTFLLAVPVWILLVLVRHSKEVVTKDDLMKTVWPDTFVEEANLSRNIFLRKAPGETPQNQRYIVTVPGQGYRLAEDVRLV